jgi:HAD superfamily hydrolase (TIGR01459 family)
MTEGATSRQGRGAPGHGPVAVEGLGALADRFDGFILDQWGVLHNGAEAYPDVIECLDHLAGRGKRIVVLSNSAKRAAANAKRLAAMGIVPPLYTAIVTSGETARRMLRERRDPFIAGLGKRCHFVSADGDCTVLDGLGLELAGTVAAADFVLLAGVDWENNPPVESYDALLQAALRRGLPMLCANPDRVGVSASGLTLAPGAVAARYAAMGGTVRYVGKPHPEVYRDCMAALGGLRPERIVAVGDSFEHDIAGAAGAGLASVLVTGGIHAEALAPGAAGGGLAAMAKAWGVAPDWTLPALRW